jgi:hypothetical protein
MTSIPFEGWAKEVFFPAVEERRRQWNRDDTVVMRLRRTKPGYVDK